VLEGTPSPSEASTAASKATDGSLSSPQFVTRTPNGFGNEPVLLEGRVPRQPEDQPLASRVLRGEATGLEDGSTCPSLEVSFSAPPSNPTPLQLDTEQQAVSSAPLPLRRQPIIPSLALAGPKAGGTSWQRESASLAPGLPVMRRTPAAPPFSPMEGHEVAADSAAEGWRGCSERLPAQPRPTDKAEPLDVKIGDLVVVDGRRGIISWNGLPEHAFAAVRWDDDGQESDPLPLYDIRKVD